MRGRCRTCYSASERNATPHTQYRAFVRRPCVRDGERGFPALTNFISTRFAGELFPPGGGRYGIGSSSSRVAARPLRATARDSYDAMRCPWGRTRPGFIHAVSSMRNAVSRCQCADWAPLSEQQRTVVFLGVSCPGTRRDPIAPRRELL